MKLVSRLSVLSVFVLMTFPYGFVTAQSEKSVQELQEVRETVEKQFRSLRHRIDTLDRKLDEIQIVQSLSSIAHIDSVRFTGPPKRYQPNPTAQGAGNSLIVYAHVFIPRAVDQSQKLPLIVLPHGGVHSHLTPTYTNIIAELIQQGYTIIAPEYRGSTGYGTSFYEAIDYGGREVEDTYASLKFALNNYEFLDPKRVGIIGWSHGGLHALFNIFEYPDAYAVAYAGVPVSDLIARMGYKTQEYRDLYSADHHVGKTAYEDVEEYRRRSPSWNVKKYQGTPLLIHTTTNDQDVNVLEVERLIQALKAEGKQGFEYKIYNNAPGAHTFNRLDTQMAKASRREIWDFLAKHLSPPLRTP